MATTIQISRENRERLSSFGKAGESLDDALNHVLKFAEEARHEVTAQDDEQAQNITELNELSDECLRGNFGFSEEYIKFIRKTAQQP